MQPKAPENSNPSSREAIVNLAVETWKKQLIDVGGRNNLLYFKTQRRGTMDLSGPTIGPKALADLQKGMTLFPSYDHDQTLLVSGIDAAYRSNDVGMNWTTVLDTTWPSASGW